MLIMSTNDSAAEAFEDGNPFPHSTTREALASRINDRSYFKKQAVMEAGVRVYYILGFVGQSARQRAIADGRKTVTTRDCIDSFQMDLPRKLI